MGAPEDVIARLDQEDQTGDFAVWDENWPVVEAFLAVCTQWRTCARGMDGVIYWQGLDYAGVAAGLAGAGIASQPSLWAGLRIMEAAARNVLNGIREVEQ